MIDDFDFDNDISGMDSDMDDSMLDDNDVSPHSDLDDPPPYDPTNPGYDDNPNDVVDPSPRGWQDIVGTHSAMSRARSAWDDPFGNPFSQPTNAWEREGVGTDDEKTGGELRENANRESEPEKSGSDNVHFGNRDQCIAACKLSRTTYESKMKVVYD